MNSSSLPRTARWLGAAAALCAGIGVALGAFGAHALKDALAAANTTETWRTAVLYHLVHATAAFAATLALGQETRGQRWTRLAALSWLAGVVLFSGSLYALALGGPRFLGPITPLGGLLFLSGWLLAALAFLRPQPKT
jgi:uncharacterized membrane protein YgdD (TMEM256/DUF423 family)